LNQFAEWLSTTSLSVFLQNHNSWAVPTIQSIHIIGIAVVIGSAFMLSLRILGVAGMDQTLRQTTDRFGPWLTGTFWVLLASGILLVVAEPVRELVTFSFWMKMSMVAIMALIVVAFRRSLRKHEQDWEQRRVKQASIRSMTVVTFLIWIFIIVLGRLIAYDHVWGAWSPSKKA
jgi:uncharacterized membrane protein SirB2